MRDDLFICAMLRSIGFEGVLRRCLHNDAATTLSHSLSGLGAENPTADKTKKRPTNVSRSSRSEADSNRCTRFCRPLPSHSAIRPYRRVVAQSRCKYSDYFLFSKILAQIYFFRYPATPIFCSRGAHVSVAYGYC